MRKLALAYALLFAGIILFFGVKPELFFDMIHSLTWPWLLFGGAFRLGFGVLLIGAAATARYPTFLKIIGAITILGGLTVPILGADTISEMTETLYGRNVWGLRIGCAFSFLFLAFVVYALGKRQDGLRQLNAAATLEEGK
jgi:hypothetical protein